MKEILQLNDEKFDGEAEENIPFFLLDTIATLKFFRRAGEWDLEVPSLLATDTSPRWIHDSISQFLLAFSWASIQSIVFSVEGSNLSWNRQENKESLLNWITSKSDIFKICYGFEARIDINLNWSKTEVERGKCKINDAARLMLDLTSATYTFTIWINLFTDIIDLYKKENSSIFKSSRFPFQAAAQLNRSMLTSSLKKWESLTGGQISSWESELVDGVGQYGFCENAYPV